MFKKEIFIILLTLFFVGESFSKEKASIPSLSLGLDVSLGVVSASVALTGLYFIKNTEVPNKIKDKSTLLPWDKPFAGVYSPKADFLSDIFNGGSLILPIAVGGIALGQDHLNSGEFLSILAMYGEALALQSGLNLLIRSFQLWPRPYLYKDSKRKKASGEAYGSFYSGHVSASFTGAVFSSYLFYKLMPNSKAKYWATGASFGLATAVAIFRVAAGKHYPTDILAGALVGSGVSVGVIALHEYFQSDVSLSVAPGSAVLSFSF